MLIILLFVFGITTRLLPHLPNFTPIMAIALFSGAYLNKKYSLWIPLLLYIVSDLIIGLHPLVFFTWGSIILISLLGRALRKQRGLGTNLVYSLFSAILFFMISNFGVWLEGWYGYSLSGLVQCYVMAIPFLRISLLANSIYIILLTGVYGFVSAKIESERIRVALLTD